MSRKVQLIGLPRISKRARAKTTYCPSVACSMKAICNRLSAKSRRKIGGAGTSVTKPSSSLERDFAMPFK